LRRHSTAAAAAAAAPEATASACAAAAAAETATATVAVTAATAAESAAITEAATSAAAVAGAFLEGLLTELLFFAEETVALVSTASAAVPFAPLVETHACINFLVPANPQTNALGPKAQPVTARVSLTHLGAALQEKSCRLQ